MLAGITFTDCKNYAVITGSGTHTAGIMGYADGSSTYRLATFENCGNAGTVNGQDYTAGIAGQLVGSSSKRSYGIFTGCSNTGTISGANYTGGIVGSNDTYSASYPTGLTRCFNTGIITGSGNIVGGLAGNTGKYSTLTACYNAGSVSCTAAEPTAVGGIAGLNDTSSYETGCFNYGVITAAGSAVGAIAGQEFAANTNCYYLNTSLAAPVDAGAEISYVTSKTAAEFKQIKMAYDLNTSPGGVNSGLWSWDAAADYPVFADDTYGAVCKITINPREHGAVAVAGEGAVAYVTAGSSVIPVITPESSEYVLQELVVTVTDGTATSYCGDGISFTMPASDITLTATFAYTGAATSFPVIFDANHGYFASQGSGTTTNTVNIDAGEKLPVWGEDPVRETDAYTQYTFAGWYTDAAGTTVYDFNKAVVTELHLYAQWQEVDRVTVNFDLNLSDPYALQRITDLGLAPAGQVAYKNHPITKPAGFLEENETLSTAALVYEFLGWYTAAADGEKWDFTAHVIPADYAAATMAIYARWGPPAPASYFEEAGDAADPYKIENLTDLNNLRKSVNEGTNYEGKYFLLVADIDLSTLDPAETWTPIGTNADYPFKGNFNGNGKTISNLTLVNGTSDYQGLFGYVTGATVKNLTVTGSVAGKSNVGGIAGYAAAGATFEACIFGSEGGTSSVSGAGNYTGGIAGYVTTNGMFKNCVNYAVVSGSSTGGYTGGIAGYNTTDGTFDNCANHGAVSSGTGGYAGGLAGSTETNSVFISCLNDGAVSSAGNHAGGVTGFANFPSGFTDCTNNGSVAAGNADNTTRIYAGGIVGRLAASASKSFNLLRCHNTGGVSSTGIMPAAS